MAATNKAIIDDARKRGITITQTEDGHQGSFIHNGQEYILEGKEGVQALADDMSSLEEIITQDDLFSVEWNEDANRYIISVNGEEGDFSDEKLRKAFQKAKAAVMASKEPEPSPLPDPAPPKPTQVTSGKRTQKPTPAPASDPKALQAPNPAMAGNGPQAAAKGDVSVNLPGAVLNAVEDLLGAVSSLLYAIKNGGELKGEDKPAEPDLEPFEEPEIEELPAPPLRKPGGLQRRAAK